jgi:hypothetical protein
MHTPPQPTLAEPPLEELRKLVDTHPWVICYFKRRNNKGGIGQLQSQSFQITDLLDDTLLNWVIEVYGGGAYIIEVRDPNNPTQHLCPRFSLNIDNVPPKGMTADGRNMGALAPGAPPMSFQVHAGMREGLPVGHYPLGQGPTAAATAPNPRDYATFTSDVLAVQQTQELREELKRTQAENARRQRALELQLENERKQREADRVAHERALQEQRDRELREQIAALRSAPPPKPAIDMTAIITMVTAGLGALVPLFVAMVNAGKDRQQLALDAQKSDSERQMNLFLQMIKRDDGAQQKQFMEMMFKLIDAQKQSPDKLAEVIATMSESQMQTLHMTAQVMQQLAPPEDTPGMQIVKTLLEGAQDISRAVITAQQPQRVQVRAVPPQPRTQVIDAEATPAQAAEAAGPERKRRVVEAPPGQANGVNGETPPPMTQPTTPEQLAKVVVADPTWPDDMKNGAWQRMIAALHTSRDPQEVGEEIARTLQGLKDIGELTPLLHPMFEDNGPAPSALLRPIFDRLPIASPEYTEHYNAVLAVIDAQYVEDEPQQEDVAGEEPALQ